MDLRAFDDIAAILEPALSMRCPHCDVYSVMSLQDIPSWQRLQTERPRRMGIVATCPSCRRPVFLVSGSLTYEPSLIKMEDGFLPVQQPRDPFETRLLPTAVRALSEEALACYQAGHFQALCLVAHKIVITADDVLGGSRRLDLFNTVTATAEFAEMEPALLRLCRSILFNLDEQEHIPELSHTQASALVALLKDLLHEAFVRPSKIRRALENAS